MERTVPCCIELRMDECRLKEDSESRFKLPFDWIE